MSAKTLTLLGALLAVACSPESTTTPPEIHGDIVRHNMAVHIMPLPLSPATGTPTDIPGPRGDVLMERYLTGKVKEPVVGSSRPSVTSGGAAGQ
ncbi:MAG TPA: hypothetical protein VD995_03885 [Azospirillum sp.]|nr:hypothetical protein [Azospirillum sp.]